MMMETIMSRSVRLVFAGGAALGIAALAQPVLAQTTDTTTAAPVQRVEITGSSIRRVDAETPSPVQVITAEDLKKSGYTTIAQVLQNVTANGQGTLSQGFSGAFAAGAQGISLRGLTTAATLVLVDGHRMASYALSDDGQRSFVDISNIPFDAIERVEILKDGASAQYGSDAMAGVVNVILKKNFTGTTVNAEAGGSTEGGGATRHFSLTTGFGDLEADGYNAFASLEYRHQNDITAASRAEESPNGGWTTTNWSKINPLATNFTPGVPTFLNGNTPAIPGSVYLFNSAGAAGAGGSASSNPANYSFLSGACNSYALLSSGGCAYKPLGTLQPQTDNLNLLTSFTKRLSGDWQVAVKASLFTEAVNQNPVAHSTFGGYGPGIGGSPGVNPFVNSYPVQPSATDPITVPTNYPGNTTGAPASVIGFDDSSPINQDKIQNNTYRIAIDFTGSIGEWDTQTSFGWSKNTVSQDTPAELTYNLDSALNRPVNPYNVLGANNIGDVNSIYPDNVGRSKSDLGYAEFHATRSLMQLAGGDLGFSAGGSFTYKNIDSVPPDYNANGLVPNSYFLAYANGKQTDTALFAEVAAPLAKTFELDGHLRYDHFGDVGSNNSATPALGFKWTPTNAFALRGTLATGFRAPNPAEAAAKGESGQIYVGSGYYQSPNANAAAQGQATCSNPSAPLAGEFIPACGNLAVFNQSNPDLKPEKSTSGTLGVILEPIKGWSSTVDLYQIKVTNQIIAPSTPAGPWVLNSSPEVGQCATGVGTATYTCTVTNAPLYLENSYVNANSTKVTGLELESHYKWKLGGYGALTTGIDWSHTASFILTTAEGQYQLAGTHGPSIIGGNTGNPKDRIQLTLDYALGNWDLTTALNYVEGYSITDPSYNNQTTCTASANGFEGGYPAFPGGTTPPSNYCNIGSFMTTDFTLRYKYSKQLNFHVAINNAFNRQPPVDLSTYGGLPYQDNPSMHMAGVIGRFAQAGLTYSF